MSSAPAHDQSETSSFREEIAFIGKELFTELLSELTRKRQNYLLAWSILTILTSLSYVTIQEVTIIGIKIRPDGLGPLKEIFGTTCIYFIILFSVACIKDYSMYGYKFFSLTPKIDSLVLTCSNEYQSAVKSARETSSEILKENLIEKTRIEEEFSDQVNLLQNKLKPLQGRRDYRVILELDRFYEEFEALKRMRNKKLSTMREKSQEVLDTADMTLTENLSRVEHQSRALGQTIRWQFANFILGFLIEISFPIMLGFIAVLLSFGWIAF